MRMLLLLLASMLLVGCGSGELPREEYLRQSQAIALDFQNSWKQAQVPDVKGKPRAEALKLVAESIRQDAARNDGFAQRMRALVPPEGLAGHKRVFLATYEGLSEKMRAWAAAIESGDKVQIKKADKDLTDFLPHSIDETIRVVESAGEDATQLRAIKKEIVEGAGK